MRRRVLILAAVALLLAGCSDRLEGRFGEELYRQGCAHCHGADLTGGTGPDIGPGSNSDLVLTDQQLADVIKVGPGSMPSYERRLSESQIDSLVTYMRLAQRGPSPD